MPREGQHDRDCLQYDTWTIIVVIPVILLLALFVFYLLALHCLYNPLVGRLRGLSSLENNNKRANLRRMFVKVHSSSLGCANV